MITDIQLDALEGSLRLTVQKVINVRICDRQVRACAENPQHYSDSFLRSTEKSARHADHLLTAAIDELRDLLSSLPTGNRTGNKETAGDRGEASSSRAIRPEAHSTNGVH